MISVSAETYSLTFNWCRKSVTTVLAPNRITGPGNRQPIPVWIPTNRYQAAQFAAAVLWLRERNCL